MIGFLHCANDGGVGRVVKRCWLRKVRFPPSQAHGDGRKPHGLGWGAGAVMLVGWLRLPRPEGIPAFAGKTVRGWGRFVELVVMEG